MTIQDVLAWIKKQQEGQTYLDALNAHLESLASAAKGDKDSIKKLQDEAKANKEKLEKANAKVEKFADALGVSEDSETLDDDISNALKAKGGAGDPALQRKIERLQKQLNDKTKELTEQLTAERGKRHDSVIKNALLAELTAQNALEPNTLLEMFRGKVKVNEDDSLLFGENQTVKEGVAAWLKDHPAFVTNKQKPGAGGSSGGGSEDDQFLNIAKNLGKSAKGPENDPAAVYFK